MTPIRVFYNPAQSITVEGSTYSPSIGKPEKVVSAWRERFGAQIAIEEFQPVTHWDLYQVHNIKYVDGVLTGVVENGFGTKDLSVAQSLLYTSGSLRAAGEYAIANKTIAVSPTSGFHHARWNAGAGYCTFNGLALTAKHLTDKYGVRVSILDLDEHPGDGTEDILDRLGLLGSIGHHSIGEEICEGDEALLWLNESIEQIIHCERAEIVLYQAGADSHIDDPMGGRFTTDQYRRRDQIVFETLTRAGVSVAWNLAGGYQEPISRVIDLHEITMVETLRAMEGQSNNED